MTKPMIMIGRLLYLLLAVLLTHSLEAFSTSEMKNRRIDDRHTLSPSSSRASGTKSSNNNNIIRRKTSDVASAAVVILSFQLLTVPVVSTAADIANGSKLFDYNCAACHRGGMNYVSEKKTLQKDAIEKYRKTRGQPYSKILLFLSNNSLIYIQTLRHHQQQSCRESNST